MEGLVERARKLEAARAEPEGRSADMSGLWLFSTRGKVAMIFTTPGKRVTEISTGMAGESFDLRDIRRTAETMLAGLGVSKDVRAQLLSHAFGRPRRALRPAHLRSREARAALMAWEARLTAIEKDKAMPGNVVRLHSAA